jgi:bacterioferritin-associated ferredoxin
MFICICNPVTDSEVRRCVREGACSLSDLQMRLGIAAQCGTCAPAAVALIEETRAVEPALSGFQSAA